MIIQDLVMRISDVSSGLKGKKWVPAYNQGRSSEWFQHEGGIIWKIHQKILCAWCVSSSIHVTWNSWRQSPRCSTDFDAWWLRGRGSSANSLSCSRKAVGGTIELRDIIQLEVGISRQMARCGCRGAGRGRQRHSGGRRCQKSLQLLRDPKRENTGCGHNQDFTANSDAVV